MKTEYELCYDRFVISNISHMAVSAGDRVLLLLDFLATRDTKYDLLCELTYLQAIGQAPGQSLWLTPFGEPYLSDNCKSNADTCLITAGSAPVFQDDLNKQFQMISQQMQASPLFK